MKSCNCLASGLWPAAPIALLQCTLQLDDSAQLELTSLSRRLGCLNEAVDEERIERGKWGTLVANRTGRLVVLNWLCNAESGQYCLVINENFKSVCQWSWQWWQPVRTSFLAPEDPFADIQSLNTNVSCCELWKVSRIGECNNFVFLKSIFQLMMVFLFT